MEKFCIKAIQRGSNLYDERGNVYSVASVTSYRSGFFLIRRIGTSECFTVQKFVKHEF